MAHKIETNIIFYYYIIDKRYQLFILELIHVVSKWDSALERLVRFWH